MFAKNLPDMMHSIQHGYWLLLRSGGGGGGGDLIPVSCYD